MQGCDAFICSNPGVLAGRKNISTLAFASAHGLHQLRKEAAANVLADLLSADVPFSYPAGVRHPSFEFDEEWAGLPSADYRLLLRGMVRAWLATSRKSLRSEVDADQVFLRANHVYSRALRPWLGEENADLFDKLGDTIKDEICYILDAEQGVVHNAPMRDGMEVHRNEVKKYLE